MSQMWSMASLLVIRSLLGNNTITRAKKKQAIGDCVEIMVMDGIKRRLQLKIMSCKRAAQSLHLSHLSLEKVIMPND